MLYYLNRKNFRIQLILGSSVETIGTSAFYNYQGTDQDGVKKELIIPDNVQTIGEYAFHYFNGSNLTLGSSINSIGDYAFSSYVGQNININKTEEAFSIVSKGYEWKYSGANLVYLLP